MDALLDTPRQHKGVHNNAAKALIFNQGVDCWECWHGSPRILAVCLFDGETMVDQMMVLTHGKGGKSWLACHLSSDPSTQEILPGVERELV
eukprot:3817813-Ditylum_brightwellii.AAC.1